MFKVTKLYTNLRQLAIEDSHASTSLSPRTPRLERERIAPTLASRRETQTRLTESGLVMGTLAYISAYEGFLTFGKDADSNIPIFAQGKAEFAKLK
jgi:hypothetical protein